MRHTRRLLLLALSLFANLLPTLSMAVDGLEPTNGLPSDPSFFPLGVWLQNPSRASAYKAIGINTFVGLWQGPTESELTQLAGEGMLLIVEQNEAALNSANGKIIRAWMQKDEPDNAQPLQGGGYGPCIPAVQVLQRTREMKRRDPTRPILLGLGKGVADPRWTGRGSCTGDLDYYPIAMTEADLIAFDVYPIADASLPVRHRIAYIADGMDRLMNWKDPRQRIWAAIETTKITNATDRPTPMQIRSEVWMAIISGATGITYFVHEFADGMREDGIFRHPDAVAAVAGINAEIRELAPALNAPAVSGIVRTHPSIRVMARAYMGRLYLFAVSMRDDTSFGEIEIPGYEDTVADVFNENRQLHLTAGRLSDTFAPYGVHIYILTQK
jgi:hypothetical protein